MVPGNHDINNPDAVTFLGLLVEEVAGIFVGLRDARIEPTEFSQKVATLDDAFLKIIGSSREEE